MIAVDAEYGIGKTFFLTRLARQLSAEHAVAYVDAWSDDFVGQPLISIATTLKRAVENSFGEEKVATNWKKVASKAGQVALIAAKGVGVQAAKVALSGGAVSAIEGVIGEDILDENDVEDAIKDGLSEDDFASAMERESEHRAYLEKQILEHEAAKSAVNQLRKALAELSAATIEAGRPGPIYVIIDELDRCRPDYALKMLEQIKHLFNVPGVCFLLGMNSDQLANSISHEYGSKFNGNAYLDRFIDRKLTLPFPDLSSLCRSLLDRVTKGDNREIWYANSALVENDRISVRESDWIALLLKHYAISPRGVFKFFDRLQTSLALIGPGPVFMTYLCELIAIDLGSGQEETGRPWSFRIGGGMREAPTDHHGAAFFNKAKGAFEGGTVSRRKTMNSDATLDRVFCDFFGVNGQPGAESYHLVIQRLSRFTDPEIEGAEDSLPA